MDSDTGSSSILRATVFIGLINSLATLELDIFKCDECGREFEIEYQLEMHTKFLHSKPQGIFTCDKCGQEFSLKHQLDYHLSNVRHDANEKPSKDYRGNRPAQESRKLY
jgi:DNA-directed RNA polymerase subunit RPC12/RpoP